MTLDRRRLPSVAKSVVVAAAVLGACSDAAPIPTYEVLRRDFDHRVIAEGFLRATEVTPVTVPGEVHRGGRIVWMAPDGSEIQEGEAVMRLDHYDLDQRLEEELSELRKVEVARRKTTVEGRALVETAATRKDLAELELGLAERFRRRDPSVFSRREIIDSEIDEDIARTRQGYAEEMIAIEGERTRAQVDVVELQRQVASFEVDLARTALTSLELRAPKGGLLLWNRDWKGEPPQIGEQVVGGQLVGEIPDLARLEAEVFVLEADAGGVAPGKPVELRIDAHPQQVYPARVVDVDVVAKPRFRASPVQYLGVTVELTGIDPAIMKPGQRITASILIHQEANGLVVPRQALFLDEGGYFVHLARGDSFVKKDVDVRTVAPGLALVEAGLEEGQIVALEEPAAALRRQESSTAAPGSKASTEAPGGFQPAPARG